MIYTLGYSGLALSAVKAFIESDPRLVLVDIRMRPASRIPDWSKKRLAEALGPQYMHVPEFGNVNYKSGPILIQNPEGGLMRAGLWLEAGQRPVLLCACADWMTCHRAVVAAMISEKFKVAREHMTLSKEGAAVPLVTTWPGGAKVG